MKDVFNTLGDDARYYRILRCATEGFLINGYVGSSVENIAIDASVSKLTIYRFFKDKVGLAAAVLEGLAESMEGEMRGAVDPELSPEDCFVKVGLTYQRWMQRSVGNARHYFITRLIIDILALDPSAVRGWVDACNRAIVYPLAEYIENRIALNEMSGRDPNFIASRFLGYMYHPAESIVVENVYNKEEAMMKEKVKLFIGGCAGKKS